MQNTQVYAPKRQQFGMHAGHVNISSTTEISFTGESFCARAEKAFDSKHCLSISTHVHTSTHARWCATRWHLSHAAPNNAAWWAMCNFNLYSYHHFITLSHTNLIAYYYPTNNGNHSIHSAMQTKKKRLGEKKYVHAYIMCTFLPRNATRPVYTPRAARSHAEC